MIIFHIQFLHWIYCFLSLSLTRLPRGSEDSSRTSLSSRRARSSKKNNGDELKQMRRNLQQPTKKNRKGGCLALGLERLSLERPRVSRKCHIWLAPELLSVLSRGRLSCFFFPPPGYVFYFVLECVARHRAALLGSALIHFFLWYVN